MMIDERESKRRSASRWLHWMPFHKYCANNDLSLSGQKSLTKIENWIQSCEVSVEPRAKFFGGHDNYKTCDCPYPPFQHIIGLRNVRDRGPFRKIDFLWRHSIVSWWKNTMNDLTERFKKERSEHKSNTTSNKSKKSTTAVTSETSETTAARTDNNSTGGTNAADNKSDWILFVLHRVFISNSFQFYWLYIDDNHGETICRLSNDENHGAREKSAFLVSISSQ